jgi:hypothetical protein
MYYTKKGGFMQPTFNIRFAMHATNSLTGNWKPGGRESHPHHLLFKEARNLIGSYLTPPLGFRKPRKFGLTLIFR